MEDKQVTYIVEEVARRLEDRIDLKVKPLKDDLDNVQNCLWGKERRNGLVGSHNWVKGALKVIGIVITIIGGIIGLLVGNITQIYKLIRHIGN